MHATTHTLCATIDPHDVHTLCATIDPRDVRDDGQGLHAAIHEIAKQEEGVSCRGGIEHGTIRMRSPGEIFVLPPCMLAILKEEKARGGVPAT